MTQTSNSSQQFTFSCPLPNGLHARPASHFSEIAAHFTSECSLTNLRNGRVANGKSVLGIIAADIRYQDRCVLVVSGTDKLAASKALRRFVEETLPHCDVPLTAIPKPDGSNVLPRSLQAAHPQVSWGTPVSRGIGMGKVVILRRMTLPAGVEPPAASHPHRELDKIKSAVTGVHHRISERLRYAVTPVGTAVLQADLAMASDVFLLEKLAEAVSRGKSAAQAIVATGEFFIDLLGHSDNEYVRQRSADIEEICLQLLEEVGSSNPAAAIELSEPSVLVAETIAPQQLLALDRSRLKALVLEHSGTTSHAAILARSLGIPTLTGVRNARLVLTPGGEALVDANRGFMIPQVTPAVSRFYERERETLRQRTETWSMQSQKAAITADGERIEVAANVLSGDEVILAFENGADGIGLFRTEMIFLSREDAPSEEEQYAIYSEAARRAGGRPAIIRTFDVGGDKKVPYLNLPKEDNPFLGWRGARIYADHQELLQRQLRAVLRASAEGKIQIMVPMIASLEEVVQFKAALMQAQHHLRENGLKFQTDIKIGIMLEVPCTAFAVEQFCQEVDFFSIGTNDLVQYFFAADRSNPKVSSRFSVRHPAFLRFLDQIVEQIHLSGKWVGMCGEMAAELRNLPLLVGLGLDEISVPAAEVASFKQAVGKLHSQSCVNIVDRALACTHAIEVDELLASQTFQPAAQPLLSEHLILLESESQTKEEVIQEMVDAFFICARTDNRQLLEDAVWAREAMGPTGFGCGFAIPHCKTDVITANSICILRLKAPIQWESTQGERVSMVVLLALRDSDPPNMHLQVFSVLARKLMNDEFRQHLLKIDTAQEMMQYFSEQLGVSSEPGEVLKVTKPPHPGIS
jgi:phosphoenolpyruvate-protein phosphotransferase